MLIAISVLGKDQGTARFIFFIQVAQPFPISQNSIMKFDFNYGLRRLLEPESSTLMKKFSKSFRKNHCLSLLFHDSLQKWYPCPQHTSWKLTVDNSFQISCPSSFEHKYIWGRINVCVKTEINYHFNSIC